jgi:hypothetical protein
MNAQFYISVSKDMGYWWFVSSSSKHPQTQLQSIISNCKVVQEKWQTERLNCYAQ